MARAPPPHGDPNAGKPDASAIRATERYRMSNPAAFGPAVMPAAAPVAAAELSTSPMDSDETDSYGYSYNGLNSIMSPRKLRVATLLYRLVIRGSDTKA